MQKYRDIACLLLRVATGINFLSAVASRVGLWGEQSSGWQNFMTYAAEVNSFAPIELVPALAITATVLEVIFGLALLIGFKIRIMAMGAAALTLLFALAMSYSFGVKSALDYSVFVDCTSAFLLATLHSYRWSLDEVLKRPETNYAKSPL